ncbi:uncharacterized protein LOC143452503 [Clavelina lepadiformis]|uniref:uncharacterized protein LOC143452503 n=1 Tax=Clavelina lepadiformis TaxID=159417 RepID=UPI0040433F97
MTSNSISSIVNQTNSDVKLHLPEETNFVRNEGTAVSDVNRTEEILLPDQKLQEDQVERASVHDDVNKDQRKNEMNEGHLIEESDLSLIYPPMSNETEKMKQIDLGKLLTDELENSSVVAEAKALGYRKEFLKKALQKKIEEDGLGFDKLGDLILKMQDEVEGQYIV